MKRKNQQDETGKWFLRTVAIMLLAFTGAGIIKGVYDLNKKNNKEQKIERSYEPNGLNDFNDLEKKVKVEKFSQEDLTWLTGGMYGEARGEVASGNIDYVKGFAKTVITRAKLENKSIKEILLATRKKKNGKIIYQYTCFSPHEENKKNYQETQNPSDLKTFELCRETAKNLIKKNSFPEVTNFYVGKSSDGKKYKKLRETRKDKIPSWAFEMKNEKFVKDKEDYFIPRKPVLIASVRQTEKNPKIKAYFYYFKYF